MQRPALIGALLLVVAGVVLGATVFRTDIAQATGLAQAVTVNNTAANPVPVHEQGTAQVNVTNSSLDVSGTVGIDPGANGVHEVNSVRVFVDGFSAQYLAGVTVDYVSSMQGSGFTFSNPNASGGCGCGSSFTA